MDQGRRSALRTMVGVAGGLLLPGAVWTRAAGAVAPPPGSLLVTAFGATGDGHTDDTAAIQAAENAAEAQRRSLHFPPGVYVVNGSAHELGDGSGHWYGILKKSRVRWTGEGAAVSVLKLMDGSTAAGGGAADPNLVYSGGQLANIGFTDLGFDLNAVGNPIPSFRNCTALLFNGDSVTLKGLTVTGCTFRNGPGGNVIIVQNRRTTPGAYPLTDVTITGCLFEDNGQDPHNNDHSTVNSWARRTRIVGNTFRNSSVVPLVQRYHHNAVAEFHAGGGVFQGNTIEAYASVVVPSENFIEPWSGLMIQDNVATDLGSFFVTTQVGSAPPTKPIDRITIRNNHASFNAVVAGGGYRAALHQQHGLPVGSISVIGNTFEVTAVDSQISDWAILSQPGTEGAPPMTAPTQNLTVAGNTFTGFSAAVLLDSTNQMNWVENLRFEDNSCIDFEDVTINQRATGLWLDGSALHPINAVVRRNQFRNDAGNPTYRHAVFYNANTALTYTANTAVGLTGAELQTH